MTATETTTPSSAPEVEVAQLAVQGMHCASCVARVERELRNVPGVVDASVNLGSEEARITCSPGAVHVAALEQAVERAGYHAHEKSDQPAEELPTALRAVFGSVSVEEHNGGSMFIASAVKAR